MEGIIGILSGGVGLVLVLMLIKKIFQRAMENSSSTKYIFVVILFLILVFGGLFLYKNVLSAGREISRGERTNILPFREHSSSHLAQAQRIYTNSCLLTMIPSKIDEERWLPYIFEVPLMDKDRMPKGNPVQYYWCFDSKNPKYRECHFQDQSFQLLLELDRDFGSLVRRATEACEVRKTTVDQLPNWVSPPRIVPLTPTGQPTQEYIKKTHLRWERTNGPDKIDREIEKRINAWTMLQQFSN